MSEAALIARETLADGFVFAEAPRADDDGSVIFSDLLGGGIYRWRPKGVETVLPERQWVGGIVLDESGAVVCSGRGGLAVVPPGSNVARPLLTAIDGQPLLAVNDIEADGQGGLLGGTVDFSAIFERGEKPAPGVLFHLSPSGAVTVLREDVPVSNGMGFSPDRKIFYHSVSLSGIWAYDIGADGLPRNPVLFAARDDCDGLVVDQEGGIWVACWATGEVIRYRPDATIDQSVQFPGLAVTGLGFGGEGLSDLYVGIGTLDGAAGPGGLARIRAEIPGLREGKTCFKPELIARG